MADRQSQAFASRESTAVAVYASETVINVPPPQHAPQNASQQVFQDRASLPSDLQSSQQLALPDRMTSQYQMAGQSSQLVAMPEYLQHPSMQSGAPAYLQHPTMQSGAPAVVNPGMRVSKLDSVDVEDDEQVAHAAIKMKTPECFEVFFALTGITELAYRIEKERARRTDEGYQNPYLEIEELVVSLSFELLVGFVILFNCAMIGWEASIPEGQNETVFSVFEHLFTLFFFVEWCLRVLAFGWSWIFDPVNAADSALVFGTGVLVKWVAEPVGFDVSWVRIFTVLRGIRLVRLARAVRLNPRCKEMWILIRGLTSSGRSLGWTLVIAFAVMYIFAIAATELIGKSPSFEDDEYAQELFGNFFRAMFTMLQLITMDTYCDLVIRPMMRTQAWLGIFFIIFVCVGVFIVMNLVTAIIVDNAFAIVKEDQDSIAKEREGKKRRDLKALSDLFMEIDLDGSGELTRDELYKSLKNAKVEQQLNILEMKVTELEETWEVLDDGDGLLTIKEFTDGIRRMKGEAQAKDVADVIKKLRTTDIKHKELQLQAQRYSATLHHLETDITGIAADAREVAVLFKEMYHRLSSFIARGEKEDRHRQNEEAKLAKLALVEEENDDEEEGDEDASESDVGTIGTATALD